MIVIIMGITIVMLNIYVMMITIIIELFDVFFYYFTIGCPNSCGQVQLADIGLMGAPAKRMNAEGVMKAVPGVNVFVGGKIGEDAMLAETPMMTGIPLTEEDLIPVLTKILVDSFQGVMK